MFVTIPKPGDRKSKITQLKLECFRISHAAENS